MGSSCPSALSREKTLHGRVSCCSCLLPLTVLTSVPSLKQMLPPPLSTPLLTITTTTTAHRPHPSSLRIPPPFKTNSCLLYESVPTCLGLCALSPAAFGERSPAWALLDLRQHAMVFSASVVVFGGWCRRIIWNQHLMVCVYFTLGARAYCTETVSGSVWD